MSKKIAVMLLSDDQEIQNLVKEVDEQDEMLGQQLEFLKKQHQSMLSKHKELRDKIDERMMGRLRELGKLPSGFDPKNPTHSIDYDKEANLLFWAVEEQCGCGAAHPHPAGLPQALAALFSSIGARVEVVQKDKE